MDKDLSLKENKVKLIILICGDSKTGKKTLVNKLSVTENSQQKKTKNLSVILLIPMNF